MKRPLITGIIALMAVAAVELPGDSHAGARIFIPFPGGQVVVNPDGSGGVRFPGGSVAWPGAGGRNTAPVPPPQHAPKISELDRLEEERFRLESDIGALDKELAQRPEGDAKRELLKRRRELERRLSEVLLRIERLQSSRR